MMRTWCLDHAASGDRYRAFLNDGGLEPKEGEPVEYVLCAYQDGRWFVDHPAGTVVASGDAKNMSQAMRLAVAVYEDYRRQSGGQRGS